MDGYSQLLLSVISRGTDICEGSEGKVQELCSLKLSTSNHVLWDRDQNVHPASEDNMLYIHRTDTKWTNTSSFPLKADSLNTNRQNNCSLKVFYFSLMGHILVKFFCTSFCNSSCCLHNCLQSPLAFWYSQVDFCKKKKKSKSFIVNSLELYAVPSPCSYP